MGRLFHFKNHLHKQKLDISTNNYYIYPNSVQRMFIMRKILLSSILSLSIVTLGTSPLQASASAAAAATELSTAFTAEAEALESFKAIKATLKNPDSFSSELAEFAQGIVAKIGAVIPASDPRHENFKTIAKYAQTEIADETLSLNRLNWITFQLSVAMNPNVDSPLEIFEGANLLITQGIWKLTYDHAKGAVEGYIAQTMSRPKDKENHYEALGSALNFFRPCDRGQWVFPLVGETPVYGLKTWTQAFAEDISITGLPTKAENCDVHEGLVKTGDFAYFMTHDLLHNQTLAPSLEPSENSKHITAMQRALAETLPKIDALPSAAQPEAYGALFLLFHELVDRTEYLKTKEPLFHGTESTAEILGKMIGHSKAYLDLTISHALADPKTYYPHHFDTVDGKSPVKLGTTPFEIYNEDGSQDSIDVVFYPGTDPMPIKDQHGKFFVYANHHKDPEDSLYICKNVFYNYPTQRAFAYSIVGILKEMGLGDNGEGTYGTSLETFDPAVSNATLHGLLDRFGAKFGVTTSE